jgi:hypothetical protein
MRDIWRHNQQRWGVNRVEGPDNHHASAQGAGNAHQLNAVVAVQRKDKSVFDRNCPALMTSKTLFCRHADSVLGMDAVFGLLVRFIADASLSPGPNYSNIFQGNGQSWPSIPA